MSKEHLLELLQPVDFKAVAERGAFVYAYLRSADLTPYYIGISCNWQRPFGEHTCNIPSNPTLIRLLRSGLTYEEAQEWEITYIAHYGRVDLGTGILRNLTDGGEGMRGHGLAEFAEKAGLTANEGVWLLTPCPSLESFRADRRSSMEAAGVDPKGAFVIAAHACFNAEEDPHKDCKRQSS